MMAFMIMESPLSTGSLAKTGHGKRRTSQGAIVKEKTTDVIYCQLIPIEHNPWTSDLGAPRYIPRPLRFSIEFLLPFLLPYTYTYVL